MITKRVAGLVVAVLIAGCTSDAERPVPVADEVVRVVGGGDVHPSSVEEPMNATDLDGRNLAAMAVEPDGTLWLVHVSGRVFRVGADGELVPGPVDGRPVIGELAGAAIGPEGFLHVVTDVFDTGHFLYLLDTGNPDSGWEATELSGLPDPFVAVEVAIDADGIMYLANQVDGAVYRVGDDVRASAVAGTPADLCHDAVPGGPFGGFGLAVTTAGELVVAHPFCGAPYSPRKGVVAEPPECPYNEFADTAEPSSVAELPNGDLVFGGWACEMVWQASTVSGETVELAGQSELGWMLYAVGADADGIVYVLDSLGVVAMRSVTDLSG